MKTVRFLTLLEQGRRFPEPAVPILPILDFKYISFKKNSAKKTSLFLNKNSVFVKDGSTAISIAINHLKINSCNSALLPAYHCKTVVEPFIEKGVKIDFYDLKPSLEINFNDLKNKINSNTKVIVVIHYFGFPQRLGELRNLCTAKGIAMIEDCAHAFFGNAGENSNGSVGDYAIASTRKFFPGIDGGVLIGKNMQYSKLNFKSASNLFQLKSIFNTIENSIKYKIPYIITVKEKISHFFKKSFDIGTGKNTLRKLPVQKKNNEAMQAVDDYSDIFQKGTHFSLFLMQHHKYEKLCKKRRMNFKYLLKRLQKAPNVSPLFNYLPIGVIPYVFPLLLNHPIRDFKVLKAQGMPIFRWEEIAQSNCKVSKAYRSALIQLPCHQALRKDELDFMIKKIAKL